MRVVVGLPRRYVTFPFLMVQGARCCVATCPGVLRVEGVRCDGGERRLLALVRAGRNAAVRVMKLGPQSTPDDVQRVRHGGVSTQRRPLAADGLGGRRRPPLVAGQPHVTLRIKKIAERRTIWGAAAPRGPNSPRRAAAAKRIFQGAQEGKVAASRRVFGAFVRVPRIDRPRFLRQRNAAKSDRPRLQTHRSRSERS